jgi:hypothetical protein
MIGKYLKTKNKEKIIELLKDFALNKEVCKELNESIFYHENCIVNAYVEKNKCIGFSLVKDNKLHYLYVVESHRRSKIATNLISDLPIGTTAIINDNIRKFYEKNNFEVTPFTKKYSKAIKK